MEMVSLKYSVNVIINWQLGNINLWYIETSNIIFFLFYFFIIFLSICLLCIPYAEAFLGFAVFIISDGEYW